MYNADLKEKFIREYTQFDGIKKSCISLFNNFEPLEEEWGSDLCTKQAEDLQLGIEKYSGIRDRNSVLPLKILRAYCEWCVKNNIPNSVNGASKIQNDFIGKFKRNTVSGPVELQMYLDDFCDAESKDTVDNIIRSYFWLAFSGVKQDDALKITSDDVNFDRMLIKFNGREYPIYREAVYAIKKCCTLKQFLFEHPNYNAPVFIDRFNGKELIRGIHGKSNKRSMQSIISTRVAQYEKKDRASTRTNLELSYARVRISGIFYRLFEFENAGIEPNFETLVEEVTPETIYKDTYTDKEIQYKRTRVAKSYKADYERWKMTLSI